MTQLKESRMSKYNLAGAFVIAISLGYAGHVYKDSQQNSLNQFNQITKDRLSETRALLSDPAISESLYQIEGISENMANFGEELSKTSQNLREIVQSPQTDKALAQSGHVLDLVDSFIMEAQRSQREQEILMERFFEDLPISEGQGMQIHPDPYFYHLEPHSHYDDMEANPDQNNKKPDQGILNHNPLPHLELKKL